MSSSIRGQHKSSIRSLPTVTQHKLKQTRAEFRRLKLKHKRGMLDAIGVSRLQAINTFLLKVDPQWRDNQVSGNHQGIKQ